MPRVSRHFQHIELQYVGKELQVSFCFECSRLITVAILIAIVGGLALWRRSNEREVRQRIHGGGNADTSRGFSTIRRVQANVMCRVQLQPSYISAPRVPRIHSSKQWSTSSTSSTTASINPGWNTSSNTIDCPILIEIQESNPIGHCYIIWLYIPVAMYWGGAWSAVCSAKL